MKRTIRKNIMKRVLAAALIAGATIFGQAAAPNQAFAAEKIAHIGAKRLRSRGLSRSAPAKVLSSYKIQRGTAMTQHLMPSWSMRQTHHAV